MTGPNDGRPGGWQPDPQPPESGSSPTPDGRRLPPELDPRRPPPRRPGGPSGRPPGQRKRRRLGKIKDWSRKRIIGTVAGAMALVLLIVVGIGWVTLSHVLGEIKKINPFCHSCSRPSGGAIGDLNILLVGSDSRAGLTKQQQKELHVGHDVGQRSDTMILVHIPAGGGKAVLVSLPRDSYVTIPAHKDSTGQQVPAQLNKLNAAYSEGGPSLTVQTVEDNTHVRIDHYVEINFLGFVNMVNALGGVTICSPTAINDPVRPNPDGSGYIGSGLNIHAGDNTLNGTTGLEYVRAREFDPAEGDLGRIKRQQAFMGAMLRKAESAGIVLNVPKLIHFLSATAKSLTTDSGFGFSQIKRVALKLRSMSPSNVTLLTVPLSNTALATPVGSAVQWDRAKARKLFRDFTNDKPITNVIGKKTKLTVAPSNISLKVLNATNTAGLASKAAAALGGVGFAIGGTGNAPKGTDPSTTTVLYGASRADSAKTVVAAVPGSVSQEDDSLGTGIELVVGSNYTTVKHVTVSGSSSTTSTTAANTACTS